MSDKNAYAGTGIVSLILLSTSGIALSDAVQFILGDWFGFSHAETIARIVLVIVVLCAVCSLMLWLLRGERMLKRFGSAWLPGALLGFPVTAVVGIVLGLLHRIDEAQGWIDADTMFRLSRMLGVAAMPLTVLGCCLYVAIRRHCNTK